MTEDGGDRRIVSLVIELPAIHDITFPSRRYGPQQDKNETRPPEFLGNELW